MKKNFKPNIDERPIMIILGIFLFYLLIVGFVFYLLFLHRINFLIFTVILIIFTIIYIPRFLIINKLKKHDEIKIIDEYIMINGLGIPFSDITDFKIKKKKPVIVFFMNNKMVVFNSAIFYLKLKTETMSFEVIGQEKTQLLEDFLNNCIGKMN